jgi:hypothetical protein
MARTMSAGFLGGVALLLGLATVAWAGRYHVYSCSDPVTGAPLPTANWSSESGPVEDTCATSPVVGGLKGEAWAQFTGTHATWKFSTPADTRIVGATLYRSAEIGYRALAYWASPENEYNSTDAFDSCAGPDMTSACKLGDNAATSCEPSSCYPPSDVLVIPPSNLPSTQLSFTVRCLTGGCGGSETLHSADITLQQDFSPTATATGGSLTTQTLLQGVEHIDISASDPGAGIFQAIFEVDGKALPGQTIDANGGSCEPYKVAADGTNIFLNPAPCPQWMNNVDIPFNTAQVPDGPHQLTMLVSDAAGNTTTVFNRDVVFNNSGEYIVQLQRQEQAEHQRQEILLRGTCNGECDDHAHLVSADAKRTTRVLTRNYARSEFIVEGRLLDHTGLPMKDAVIELYQQATYLGSQNVLLATTMTNTKGYWKFRVPQGPSRVLTVGYRSHSKDPSFATQLQYHEKVRAGVSLIAPRRVHPGQSFNFRGKLMGGYIATGGTLVSLEIYYGGEWREIALLNTERNGAFAYSYSFAAVAPATYRFRASVPPAAVYPFLPAASPPAHIHLLRG